MTIAVVWDVKHQFKQTFIDFEIKMHSTKNLRKNVIPLTLALCKLNVVTCILIVIIRFSV